MWDKNFLLPWFMKNEKKILQSTQHYILSLCWSLARRYQKMMIQLCAWNMYRPCISSLYVHIHKSNRALDKASLRCSMWQISVVQMFNEVNASFRYQIWIKNIKNIQLRAQKGSAIAVCHLLKTLQKTQPGVKIVATSGCVNFSASCVNFPENFPQCFLWNFWNFTC